MKIKPTLRAHLETLSKEAIIDLYLQKCFDTKVEKIFEQKTEYGWVIKNKSGEYLINDRTMDGFLIYLPDLNLATITNSKNNAQEHINFLEIEDYCKPVKIEIREVEE